jgi:hypothetical protein
MTGDSHYFSEEEDDTPQASYPRFPKQAEGFQSRLKVSEAG